MKDLSWMKSLCSTTTKEFRHPMAWREKIIATNGRLIFIGTGNCEGAVSPTEKEITLIDYYLGPWSQEGELDLGSLKKFAGEPTKCPECLGVSYKSSYVNCDKCGNTGIEETFLWIGGDLVNQHYLLLVLDHLENAVVKYGHKKTVFPPGKNNSEFPLVLASDDWTFILMPIISSPEHDALPRFTEFNLSPLVASSHSQ